MATQVFTHGAIYTVNPKQPWAEAIAIDQGRIVYVGDNQGVQKFIGKQTRVTHLKGKMMMPGFHDVHIHPIESGSDNTHFALDIEQTNPRRYINTIRRAARQNPDAPWLIGYGHDIATLLEAEESPLDILDEAVPNRPVIIMEHTSHSMWVNSEALAMAGIGADTPDPEGGVIMRDEIHDEPNGILIDNAGNLVMDLAMAPTKALLDRDYYSLIESTLPALAEHGITSISDARSFWRRKDHQTWLKAARNDELTLRVAVGLWAYPELDDNQQIKALKSLYRNEPDSLLRFNQVKFYSDGILSNTTAAMKLPYHTNLLGLPGNRGLNYFTQSRLEKYMKALQGVGFDFHIHAIGDRGIHESLNAIERAGSKQARHRITHVEVVDPVDLPRFAKLNVTADAQVSGDFTQPSHWPENNELIGAKRANNAVPLKSLARAGARVTLSSDWSVGPFNPFIGLQNAITRAPQQLTLTDALAAYTINGAYVMRQEDQTGSIEPGKWADLVVLNQNLFDIPPRKIAKTKVLLTLLAGETVYQR